MLWRTNKDALLGFWMGLELLPGISMSQSPMQRPRCLNMHAIYMECGPPTLPQNGVDAVDIGSGLPISMTIPFDQSIGIGPSKVVLQSNSVNATELETTPGTTSAQVSLPTRPSST